VPTYEFLCEDCGPFEQQRSFVEASAPLTCPSCGLAAKRVYHMPATRKMSTALSRAMNRVEKSTHEPKVVRRPESGTLPGTRYHPGHGEHHGHNH
jgi:putative FmdB family regulatory protein